MNTCVSDEILNDFISAVAKSKESIYKDTYKLFDKGIWFINNYKIGQDPSTAVFVPLDSIIMFFNDIPTYKNALTLDTENQIQICILYEKLYMNDYSYKSHYLYSTTYTYLSKEESL